MAVFKNNGINLFYEISGSGKPLVLIPGLTCDSNHWQLIREELSSYYQLIMLDNRGIGRSDIPDQYYTIADMANDVVALLDHLGIVKADVLGHSMGGTVAQYLGYKYADQVDRLIISHSFSKFRPSAVMFCKHSHYLLEQHAPVEHIASHLLPFVYSDAFIAEPDNFTILCEALINNPYPQSLISYQQQVKALIEFDSDAWVGEINVPTLLIGGEYDRLAYIQDVKYLSSKINDSQLVIMPDAHVPMWELPGDYVKEVFKFLGKDSDNSENGNL